MNFPGQIVRFIEVGVHNDVAIAFEEFSHENII